MLIQYPDMRRAGNDGPSAPVPKGAVVMKKVLIVILASLMCLGMIALAGCGEDTAQAKEYMEKADELSARMYKLTDEEVFDVASLLAELGIQVSDTGTIDKKTVTDAAVKQIDDIIASGKKAIAEYEKIEDLKGVEAYKKYAEKRISAIKNTTAVLEAVKDLVARLGDPGNAKSVKDTTIDWAKENVTAAVDAVKAFANWTEADKIKKSNNLGPVEEPSKDSTPTSTP